MGSLLATPQLIFFVELDNSCYSVQLCGLTLRMCAVRRRLTCRATDIFPLQACVKTMRKLMVAFKSIHSYRDFDRKVVHSYRYMRDNEVDEFLSTLLKTSVGREETVSKGAILWRAQIGHGWEPMYQEEEHIADIPGPFPPKRMKPLQDRAQEGRANPKGIPYLYCSNREETALSEVRPWIGSLISLGAFEIQRDLTIINFSTEERRRPLYELARKEPGPQERNKAVWIDIDKAFSKPVTPNGEVAHYVPTQIIAEFYKNKVLTG